jgi:release factor glutamine methyltransferase
MNLSDWLAAAQRRLEGVGIESARLEAEVLAAHALFVDRTWVIAHPDAEFPEMAGETLIQRRRNHEPLAYILGHREFYGRDFRVRPGVLIPRQETETLIEAALGIEGVSKVLDIGTGSGCIAITLSLERPEWNVSAADISEKALEIARENGERLSAKINWIHANGASAIKETGFDLIVSNPPYVAVGDPLPPEIKNFEPYVALYAGPSGLNFYRRLSKECSRILNANGSLLMELGAGQLEPVTSIFERDGWTLQHTWKDLSGIDRVVGVQRTEIHHESTS